MLIQLICQTSDNSATLLTIAITSLAKGIPLYVMQYQAMAGLLILYNLYNIICIYKEFNYLHSLIFGIVKFPNRSPFIEYIELLRLPNSARVSIGFYVQHTIIFEGRPRWVTNSSRQLEIMLSHLPSSSQVDLVIKLCILVSYRIHSSKIS